MAKIESWYKQDLKKPVPIRRMETVFNQDALGHLFGVEVYSDGEAVILAGSVTGYCLLADGTTVPVSGTRSANRASIVIPQTAYSVIGPITITVKLTEGSAITTLLAVVGMVSRSRTGQQVDPGSTITDWTNQISAQLQAVQTAADNLGSTLAAPFSTLTDYAVDSYVMNNGNLYRFIADHTAGDWSSSEVTQVKVCNEIRDLKNALSYNEWAFRSNYITFDKTSFESGMWYKRQKAASAYHYRLPMLLPVTKGTIMIVSPSSSGVNLGVGYYKPGETYSTAYYIHQLNTDRDTIFNINYSGLMLVQCTINGETAFSQDDIDFTIRLYANRQTNALLNGYIDMPSGSNFDDYIIPGNYRLDSGRTVTNKPPMAGSLVLTVKLLSSPYIDKLWVTQYAEYGYNDQHREAIFKRAYHANLGVWSEWEKLASSQEIQDYYLLSRGDYTTNSIPAEADLDDYKTIGIYYLSTADASTIKNLPMYSSGKLVVEVMSHGPAFKLQTFYAYNSNNNVIYRRSFDGNSNVWSEWNRLISADDAKTAYTTIKTISASVGGFIPGAYSYGQIVSNSTDYTSLLVHLRKGDVISIDVADEVHMVSVFGYAVYPASARASWIKHYEYPTNRKIVHTVLEDSWAGFILRFTTRPEIEDMQTEVRFERLAGNAAIIQAEDNAKEIALKGYSVLEIKDFVNGTITSGGINTNPATDPNFYYRASMKDAIAFPQDGDYIIRLKEGYTMGVRSGGSVRSLSTNQYWFVDGDVYHRPDGHNYFRASIAKNTTHLTTRNNVTITPEEAAEAGLKLYYKPKEGLTNFSEKQISQMNSARAKLIGSRFSQNEFPTIAHTSDCHGDYERARRFISLCESEGIDCGCITGDIVSYDPSHNIYWFHHLVNDSNARLAICTGNHDVYNTSMNDDAIYDFLFAPIATKLQMAETGKTWYYTDISGKNIRVISFNLYQYGASSRWYTHLTEEQLNWLVATIKSTPAGYGIVMLEHAPQTVLSKDSAHVTFWQNDRLYNGTHNEVSGGVPIYDIIDAFIARTSMNKTYTQTGEPSSFTVSADFSDVDTSIEFIAHLTGHFHQDSICYVPGTAQKQLMLNVTCTNALQGYTGNYAYLADICDVTRNKNDQTQDAFNIYVIDRDAKMVKVVRIGSNLTPGMVERQYMEIPYADAN